MKIYDAISVSGIAEGCPFAAAVLCEPEQAAGAAAGLERLAEHLNIRGISDPVELDVRLAAALKQCCPPGIPAAAMTICAWKHGPVSGGVVGSPHQAEESACGRLEQLAEDLWSEAFPGGPGFVVCGNRHLALEAEELVSGQRCCGEDPWPAFCRWVEGKGVPAWLYVADGSGADGVLAACGQNGKTIVFLNETK